MKNDENKLIRATDAESKEWWENVHRVGFVMTKTRGELMKACVELMGQVESLSALIASYEDEHLRWRESELAAKDAKIAQLEHELRRACYDVRFDS